MLGLQCGANSHVTLSQKAGSYEYSLKQAQNCANQAFQAIFILKIRRWDEKL